MVLPSRTVGLLPIREGNCMAKAAENSTQPLRGAFRNLTLAALSPAFLAKIESSLAPVNLTQGYLLVKSETESQWVYFLERGMASMNSLDFAGTPVEVGIIGREGIVGVHALLGHAMTQNAIVMQGAGAGYRIRAETLREHMAQNPDMLAPLHTFLYALLEQTTQLVLCNRLHELESRLARWLLMTSDFMETRTLHLTQEFLAEMLGVGRPAVTIAAGILQRAGMIMYSRGQVELVALDKLQSVACDCYKIIHQSYARVYPELYGTIAR